jgi:mannose-1-phosphate guanylyltransferase/mannose-6-phosphate isomerase
MLPKQFVRFSKDQDASFLAATLRRLPPSAGFDRPIIVCSRDHRFLVRDEAKRAGAEPRAIVLEPVARSTAAAIAVAALMVERAEPGGVLAVMPSDHAIVDEAGFLSAVHRAGEIAATGRLVLFGIAPDQPHTGYGYIKRGAPLEGFAGAFAVAEFTEKPDLETARSYLASREYYWNSGIFVLGARAFLTELERLAPSVMAAAEAALAAAREEDGFLQLDRNAFEQSPVISVDYAVMEHTALAAVLPIDVNWSDVGSWSSLWELSRRDSEGNAIEGEAVLEATRGCYIHSEKALVAAVGVEDLVIVNTPDALLVADRARSQDVGSIVARLRKENRSEQENHVRSQHPWGFSERLDAGPGVRVSLLGINPGATLARQTEPRSPGQWVVVRGAAEATLGSERRRIEAGQSAALAPGQSHSVRNTGTGPLELIEVLLGEG